MNRATSKPSVAARPALAALALYRAIVSPLLVALFGYACRFEPSCSEYARIAISEHGLIRGGAMALGRLARCHPLGGHGFDPPPQAASQPSSPRHGRF
jgi:putative membrane protein insertion efficiency factor